MNIYIDFDDCLCETARYFSVLVKEMYGKDIPYEQIRFFNLQDSFHLTDGQFEQLMIEGHRPSALLSFEEIPGAVDTVNRWIDAGHQVNIITGRPYSAYEPSQEWLLRHGLEQVKLYCLNKYGRDAFIKNSDFSLELDDYYKMHFDFAIEDSPNAFQYLTHLKDARIMVFDRPWNQACSFPNESFQRCFCWDDIEREFQKLERQRS